jgi:hypothetical protein
LITSFVYLILLQVIEYDYDGYFVFWGFLIPALFLTGVCIFGGLIGIVIKGVTLLFKKNPQSKLVLALKKIFGWLFLGLGVIGALISIITFLILFIYPSSSLLNFVMVDFKLISVIGVPGYYMLLLSSLFILLIPTGFIVALGLIFLKRKVFLNFKMSLSLLLLFFLWLAIFILMTFHIESKFDDKKAEMKENKSARHFYIKDFDKIYISRFVEFDEIIIRQGNQFNIATKGSEYDHIGLDFEKINNDTLFIKRSELETYYNTDTWTVENRDNILFHAGTKHLTIEITIPDIEKIEIEGGNVELVDFNVDNIEIKLNKRFNNIKGNIKVEDTLRLDAQGGIINLDGSAENLIINSGDCWIEMDEFIVKNAIINARNTSRLNVDVSDDLEIELNENSGIVNHYNE